LLDLFKGEDVGRNVVLDPATPEDMRGKHFMPKPSLEVIYDDA
jgi:chlorophyllide a reductase subunit X